MRFFYKFLGAFNIALVLLTIVFFFLLIKQIINHDFINFIKKY